MRRYSPQKCECEDSKGLKKLNANQMTPNEEENWIIARKRPLNVTAKQMDRDFVINTLEGSMNGRKGDFLVVGTQGEKYIVREHIFREIYMVVRPFKYENFD